MRPRSAGKSQSFYVAVILYRSTSELPDYVPLYQECFVLIKAASLDEAYQKAGVRAEAETVSYRNEMGETINWSLQEIVDVNPVLDDSLDDGADLYVRHFRNYDAYREFEDFAG
jgi:hypothetical protein